MPFDRKRLRIQRLTVESAYHSAFNYLSFKGLIAERWAHGPIFNAFSETGYQVDLFPGEDQEVDDYRAHYGIKQSSFTAEPVSKEKEAARLSLAWHTDVLEVLDPKRVVRLSVDWFAMHPISRPEQVSRKLRERYYKPQEIGRLLPPRYNGFHSAVNIFVSERDERFGAQVGVVGPPHEGQFYARPIEGMEKAWWLGARINLARVSEDGIDDPVGSLTKMVETTSQDLERVIAGAFPQAVD